MTRIELENFRPFFGKNEIDIGYSEKKLVIFEGNTGEGKTSLAEAVRWCLFGLSSSNEDSQRADFNLFNKDALIKSKIDEPITCRVTLTFEKVDGKNSREKILFSRYIQIQRKKSLYKTLTGVVQPRLDEFDLIRDIRGRHQNFTALKWSGSQQVPLESGSETTRETYFPTIVNDYYIVFGEKFVDPHNPERIRIAIERNCFSQIFDKIKQNLEDVKIDIIKENTYDTKKREKLDLLINQKDKNIISVGSKKEELEEKKTEKIKLADGISKYDRLIGEAGSEQARRLRDERLEKEDELKQLNKTILDSEKEISGSGFSILIKMWSLNSQEQLLQELDKRIKRGEIPPNIKNEFIDSLIENGKCVCGTKISNIMKKRLEEVRDENTIGGNYQEFLNLKFKISENKNQLPLDIHEFLLNISEIEYLKTKKNDIESRLIGISEELDSLKNVDKLEKERNTYASLLRNIEDKITILNLEIDTLIREQKEIQRDIEKIGDLDKNKESSNVDKFIEKIIDEVSDTKENIIESTRKDIENFASEIYKNLFKHASEVERVELDSNYQIRVVLNKDGKHYVKTDFSTGESLVFAISFLTSLRKYSGYTGPIFLDSPFSVLDPEHRVRVSLNIPQSIPGQLIIFTRPDTFEDIRSKLNPYVNKLVTLRKEKEWHTKINVGE